ncbi:MAG: MBOAT family protein [Lachnospiraceae bacterium]|nr:MBOAT family protein [Lachnospiraceae bacterium]
MLFNSYIFILIFIPLCLLGYFLLNSFKRYIPAQCVLFGMSLWFYGYFNYRYLLIIIASILINYGIYVSIGKLRDKNKSARALMILGVAVNLGILGFFKYTDFFLTTVNQVFRSNIPLLRIVLPLGISFFTFQQISFIVDAYRGNVGKYKFIYYASFVAFFPQLIAGPIVTHDELITQFTDESKKKFNFDNLVKGIFLFTIGLSKKVLIADVLGAVVNYGYVAPERLNSGSAWIVILAYTLQIYFDFSGYCDMAVGLGKMFNIDIPFNFNSPYLSTSITEFWDRWHMTLTRFFTKYVYIPLGGNRKGLARTCLNIFIVFLLSGFWHGAGWTFILWGVLHGLFSIITRLFKKQDKIHIKPTGLIITFIFVNITWVFFRAESIPVALDIIKTAFSFKFAPIDPIILNAFRTPELVQLLAFADIEEKLPNIIPIGFMLVSTAIAFIPFNSKKMFEKFKPNTLTLIFTILFFIWSFLSLSGVSTFLYFNF